MRNSIVLFVLVAILSSVAGMARADDWMAVRLRGQVLQLVGEQWQPLNRGDVVPDSRLLRTLANGHVTFQRGNETVTMSDNTQIRIFDRPAGRSGRPFTTVEQEFGTVAVEADVRQVQHFAVETPYVAAVVKGTRFTVVQGRNSASVSVQRGHVFVEDHMTRDRVTIGVDQSATIAPREHAVMLVAGKGTLPVVTSRSGKAVASNTPAAAAKGIKKKPADGDKGKVGKTGKGKATLADKDKVDNPGNRGKGNGSYRGSDNSDKNKNDKNDKNDKNGHGRGDGGHKDNSGNSGSNGNGNYGGGRGKGSR